MKQLLWGVVCIMVGALLVLQQATGQDLPAWHPDRLHGGTTLIHPISIQNAAPGDTVAVPLYYNPAIAVDSLFWVITYDTSKLHYTATQLSSTLWGDTLAGGSRVIYPADHPLGPDTVYSGGPYGGWNVDIEHRPGTWIARATDPGDNLRTSGVLCFLIFGVDTGMVVGDNTRLFVRDGMVDRGQWAWHQEPGYISTVDMVKGDANMDGAITAYDAAITLRHTVGLQQWIYTQRMDFSNDGAVNAYDAALMLRRSVGL